eukprot:g13025.t1 g13025   contig7:705047-706126(-)
MVWWNDYYGGCGCVNCVAQYGSNRWPFGSREKSSAASNRELRVKEQFNKVKYKVEAAVSEKTKVIIKLGCLAKSESSLKQLPSVIIESICDFADLPKPTPRPISSAAVSNSISFELAASNNVNNNAIVESRTGRRARKSVNYSELDIDILGRDADEQRNEAEKLKKELTLREKWDVKKGLVDETDVVDLADITLYQPGAKIAIPITNPMMHLTGPCWRDFKKAVRKNKGWDVKRFAATEEEKKEHKVQRKGNVYFIDAIYTVPGSTAVEHASKEYKANPTATAALREALEFAATSRSGTVSAKSLKRAIGEGYSKHFIMAQVEKQKGEMDVKHPAAKKAKTKSSNTKKVVVKKSSTKSK